MTSRWYGVLPCGPLDLISLIVAYKFLLFLDTTLEYIKCGMNEKIIRITIIIQSIFFKIFIIIPLKFKVKISSF